MSKKRFEQIYSKLHPRLGNHISREVPLAPCTSFGIGGPTALFINLHNLDHLHLSLQTLKEYDCPVFVLGDGCNLLVSDEGFRGAVVKLAGDFSFVETRDVRLRAGAGTSLSKLVKEAQGRGLSGFAFAVGIPGSVGGAIAVNAGAFGSSIGERLVSAIIYDVEKGSRLVKGEDFGFSYRKTSLDQDFIILEALFELEPAEPDEVRKNMDSLFSRRIESQPYGSKTAGCVFKNPEGRFAGELIEQAGCKGLSVGDAVVSEIHANFVINRGRATAEEVYRLTEMIKERVYQKEGILLEKEIVLLGEFGP